MQVQPLDIPARPSARKQRAALDKKRKAAPARARVAETP
jgi:hypothetical protein